MTSARSTRSHPVAPEAKLSVVIFLVGLLSVMAYATAISKNVGLITDPVMTRDKVIVGGR